MRWEKNPSSDEERGQESSPSAAPPELETRGARELEPRGGTGAAATAAAGGVEDEDEREEISRNAIAKKQAEHNIFYINVLTFFFATCFGILQGPIFDNYVYILTQQNFQVGVVESVSGIVSLVCAMPVAYLVDKGGSRARSAKFSAPIGALSLVIFGITFSTDSIPIMYIALVLMGIFYEIQSSVSEALFADSIITGGRSKIFARKALIGFLGFSVGGLLTTFITVILKFGDSWPLASIHIVLSFGGLTLIPCLVCLANLYDPQIARIHAVTNEDDQGLEAGAENDNNGDVGSGSCSSPSETPSMEEQRQRSHTRNQRFVPVILTIADFIGAIGSGMTVKFFALFFINDIKFNATQIAIATSAYPLSMGIFTYLLQKISVWTGRAQASFGSFFLNTCCFVLLYWVRWEPALVAIFLIRGGLANANSPLDRSILMDYTSSKKRGWWNALQSFSSSTWSGSALLGGFIIDSKDYRFSFLITGGIYLAVSLIYSPLLFLIPRKEAHARSRTRVLEEPLVS